MGLSENFIDRVELCVRSGDGGDGIVHFRHEKYVQKGGPDGGDGGKGGSVIFISNSRLSTLNNLRYIHHIFAKKGQNGGKNNCTGKNAQDVIVKVPVGTILYNKKTREKLCDLSFNEGEYIIKGGKGGLGNTHFKSPTNQAPLYAQKGQNGIEMELILELNILADVGIVGFPNAGKSTLLTKLTNAKAKIANYAFTTLSPQLGVLKHISGRECTIADIPGIIEDSSSGKGLGIRFLQHIRRVKLIVFLIDINDDTDRSIKILQKEMNNFDPELNKKPYITCISKCDLVSNTIHNVKYIYISSFTGEGISTLIDRIFANIM